MPAWPTGPILPARSEGSRRQPRDIGNELGAEWFLVQPASDLPTATFRDQLGDIGEAPFHYVGASWMEATARRRQRGVRYLAPEGDRQMAGAVCARYRLDQRLGIWMHWRFPELGGWGGLDDDAQGHHGGAGGDRAEERQAGREEQHAHIEGSGQPGEEDRPLWPG